MKLTHSCGHVVHYETRVSSDVDLVSLVKWAKEQEAKKCPACIQREVTKGKP